MVAVPHIFVGLGNPGDKYIHTRHNIGFDVIDAFANTHKVEIVTEKWDGLTAKIKLGEETIYLVKPMTFMNLSGKSVSRFVDFFKVPPERLLIVHDDLDMKLGRLKLVKGGGAGGHNGIRSIISTIGSAEFYRLKIGIGRPGDGQTPEEMPVDRYVLTPFSQPENELLQNRMSEILQGLELFFSGAPSRAMNFLNSFK